MFHHPIPLVPRRLLARCGGHARESGVVRSLIKLNNIISLVRERSLLRSLVHYFSWGKRACSHGHYSVFRVSPYSATPLQGCMPPHTENHWPMNRRLSSSHKPSIVLLVLLLLLFFLYVVFFLFFHLFVRFVLPFLFFLNVFLFMFVFLLSLFLILPFPHCRLRSVSL